MKKTFEEVLKANCDYDVDIKEFNIKDNINDIYKYIISNNYEVIGLSCYIWNISIIKSFSAMLHI